MKKLFSLVLALVMMLALAANAMAADITVTGAEAGETYNAYKIFDYTSTEKTATGNYAYTIDKSSAWFDVVNAYDAFKLTASATDANKYVVTIADGKTFSTEADAKAFADYLMKNLGTKAADATATADESGVAKIDSLVAGYYFVDTSLGSLCALFNADTDQVLKEKNAEPKLDKVIMTATGPADATDASIGEMVNYRITVFDGTGTDSVITVHDKMEAGLSLKEDSFKISADGKEIAAKGNYKIVVKNLKDECTFEVIFTADFVKSLDAGEEVYIDYSAKLNQFAEIASASNDNTAWLTYSAQTSAEKTVNVYTYKFNLNKVDEKGDALDGASFKLYDEKEGGKEINLIKVADGKYQVADVVLEEYATIEVGSAVIEGLGNGSYWLEETEAPDGYNLLTERKEIVINGANGEITVVNQTGTQLPSTGGVGTTIFYTVGGVMMAAAFVLFVTKKKMANEQ